MKSYQDYYEEWVLSVESRDLLFDEWLMLQLDRKEKQMIDKACEWLNGNLGYYNRNEVHIGKSYEQRVIDDFRKAMEEEK